MRNRNVEDILVDYGYGQETTNNIVRLLIENGFVEADKISEPEKLAEAAKKWLGTYGGGNAKQIFDKASGWSTESWNIVVSEGLGETYNFNDPMKIKNIFATLVILAKEAEIDL